MIRIKYFNCNLCVFMLTTRLKGQLKKLINLIEMISNKAPAECPNLDREQFQFTAPMPLLINCESGDWHFFRGGMINL